MNFEDKSFIDRVANAVIETFNIAIPIVNIHSVVASLGGEVEFSSELGQYAEGRIQANDYNTFIITIPKHHPPKRQTFTIAHELGHLFLHMGFRIDDTLWRSNIGKAYHRNGNSKAEYEAHTFAASLLMPEFDYKKAIEEYTDESDSVDIEKVSDYFGVSVNAAINRGKWLGCFKW